MGRNADTETGFLKEEFVSPASLLGYSPFWPQPPVVCQRLMVLGPFCPGGGHCRVRQFCSESVGGHCPHPLLSLFHSQILCF